MGNIEHLHSSVHSSLRSSTILFDLPRVVEELIYNSVDARATKVSVYIGIRACCVKVEDDGYGITRDGLVILGQRYATSKHCLLADMESSTERLGFKGEALGSLSDVSLLEIRTKARGKPNAYCKILKGSKCLFLGIDDKREFMGTTVIVRDLFYNQPVRRKYMQSSPKRVLHLVKKCVLRIALVHPHISFRVTDIESEDELLCTVPSSSPLSLVSDGFGNDVSSSLHEIVSSDKFLVLSGYISGPSVVFSSRAFQYLYINSRFVCKGPVHNLINNLAASFQCSLSQRKLEPDLRSGKRQKTQGYPTYMLNFCCPLSSYDLNFEPSKTVVEFKDWETVLSFFEKAITHFWEQLSEQPLQGKTVGRVPINSKIQKEDMFAADTWSSKTRKKEFNIQFYQDSPRDSTITSPPDTSSKDISTYEKHGGLPKELQGFSYMLKPCRNNPSYFNQSDSCFETSFHDSEDIFGSTQDQIGCQKTQNNDPHRWSTDTDSFPLNNCLFSDHTIKTEKKHDISELVWEMSPARDFKKEIAQNVATSDHFGIRNNDQDVHYSANYFNDLSQQGIESFSPMENEQDNAVYILNQGCLDFELDHLGKDISLHDTANATNDNFLYGSSNFMDSPLQNNSDASGSAFSFLRKCKTARELDALSTDSNDSYSHARARSIEENNLQIGVDAHICETGSKCESHETGWFLGSPHSLSVRLPKMDDVFTHCYTSEGSFKSFKGVEHGHSGGKEDKVDFLNPDRRVCNQVFPTMRCTGIKSNPKRSMEYDCFLDSIYFAKGSTSSRLDDETAPLFDSSNINIANSCTSSAFDISVQNHDKVVGSSWCQQKFQKFQPTIERDVGSVSQPCLSECIDEKTSAHEMSRMQTRGLDRADCNRLSHTNSIEDSTTHELEYATSTPTKWRNCILQLTDGDISQDHPVQMDDVLNISSGLLHLSGGSLVPETISKVCLEDARVLLQLDRKFIPVVAGRNLVIIDQHAADERIRLEDLRRKVLSGEASSITYLDTAQEMVLPEMGFQLLQKYAVQIQKWGWICNSNQCSGSFAKNMKLLNRQACDITLVAVPCILGINLTDQDLIEFIEQLVETDGASSLPPSVLRVLNFKACRGAIMFGDTLLPSECSLIVEELKATSLCFQCAHGRPTTVPLVNMASLHEQLARLEMQNGGPPAVWHGLSRHRPSVARAQLRLDSAKTVKGN